MMDQKIAVLKNLSERLSHALKLQNISQSELARKINVKPQVIQYLCTNNVNTSRFTYLIADALSLNGVWLATGEGTMLYEDDPTYQLMQSQHRIPLLEWPEIYQWTQQTSKNNHSNQWILADDNQNQNAFAVKMNDKSMWPRFEKNTLLIINSSQSPTDQSFVLVYILSLDEVALRQLIIQDNKKNLYPMNSTMYKSVELTSNDKILGMLVEARWQV